MARRHPPAGSTNSWVRTHARGLDGSASIYLKALTVAFAWASR